MSEVNWAGNLAYRATAIVSPNSVDEVVDLVRQGGELRALGTRHSFNAVADTSGTLVSTRHLNRVLHLDEAGRRVTVEAGIRYGELGTWLHQRGWALHNLASLPHISVGGAVATATHGSGLALGNLSSAVQGVQIVTVDGEVREVRSGEDEFPAVVVSLGRLGIVTALTLRIEPTYAVAQTVYRDLPWSAVEEDFEEVMGAASSVSLFTRWTGDAVEQVWLKRRAEEGPAPAQLFGARPANAKLHPILEIDPEHCTDQLGAPGPWHERLPHFKLEFTPSAGEELQAEYLLPRRSAGDAIRELRTMAGEIRPVLLVSEIRTYAADSLWLSPGCGQDIVGIHFTLRKDPVAVEALLPRIEATLSPFSPIPHWGKLSAMPPSAALARFPHAEDFERLRARWDPASRLGGPLSELD